MSKRTLLALAMILTLTGCGGAKTYPVEGIVVDTDGKPATDLAGFHVEFESIDTTIDKRNVSATGTLTPEATFRLSTRKSNDGAVVGKHRVLIAQPVPVGDTPSQPLRIPAKYLSYQTSGLTATVEPKTNLIKIEIERRK